MSDVLINVGQNARKKMRDVGGYHAEEIYFAGPHSASGAMLVGNNKSKMRDDFGGTQLDPDVWELVNLGSGMAITFPGATTSYLNINSGTAVNSETIIRSVEVFSLPVRLALCLSASQRIANIAFLLELIEVDEAGEPVATAPSNANSGTIRNYAGVRFDGTSHTSALVVARGGGAPETVSAATPINTTQATGTGPNFVPANLLEVLASGEHVSLLSSGVDTTTPSTAPRRITQSAPNPNALYKLQFRLINLATAPASATDYRLHLIRLFDYTRLTTEVVGGTGTGNASSPITVNGNVNAVVTGSLTSNEGTPLTGTGYALPTTGTTHLGVIKNTGGTIFEMTGRNTSAAPVFFKFFNKTTNPALGTDIPFLTIQIAAGAIMQPIEFGRFGKRFPAGIAIAVTGALADLDTTPGPSGAQISLTFI